MAIEERDLRLSPRSPLRGWRLFRVRAQADGFALGSPMYDDPDPTPWPRAKVAACTEDHPAPAPGCRCGIYAAIPGTLDSLPGYLLDTDHDPDPPAYAEVGCSGRVFVDRRGLRAERVEILRLALDESCWRDPDELAVARRLLAARYGVPVGTLEEVPAWVTANLQRGGPAPDEETVDLDSLDVTASGRPSRSRPACA